MKKICLLLNHLQLQDGVARVAIAIANCIAEHNNTEVTLIPIFKYNSEVIDYLSPRVKVKPVFRTYFKGFKKIISYIPNKWMYNFLIGDRYDINIAFQHHLTPIIAAGIKDGIVSLGWMHGYDENLRFKKSYLSMKKMICVSKCNAERLKNAIGQYVEVDYCYNPIDDEAIRQQGNEAISIERSKYVQFISVGRMSEEKGYIRLLDCINKLKNEGYKFNLWLVGDGPQLSVLKQKTESLNISDYVTFLGKRNNPHAFTAKSDVFICSSFSEGYSTACTEAVILEVPVISTNVSGSHEIIEEAECGLVTKMDDDSLYNGLKMILDNPNLIYEWKATLKKTKYNFSSQKRFEKIIKTLDL